MLIWLVFINIGATLLIFAIVSKLAAVIIYLTSGVIGYVSLIAAMKLVAKTCPRGFEATVFAIVTGVTNLSSQVLAVALGGWIYDLVGYVPLVWTAALAGLIALPFAFKIRG